MSNDSTLWFRKTALPLVSTLLFFAAWQALCRAFKIPSYFLPAPTDIMTESLRIPATVLYDTIMTLKTILLGFGLSVLVGIPLAVLISSSKRISSFVWPPLVVTQSIPKVALAPILVLVCGTNELPRVIIAFLVSFFPLVLSTATGFKNVPYELIEMGKTCHADRWTELKCIKLPFATPYIFSGLKAAITLSVVGAVVGEFVNADRGLGYLIVTSTAFFNTGLAWAAIVILSVLGIVLFQIIVLIESLWFPWSVSSGKS